MEELQKLPVMQALLAHSTLDRPIYLVGGAVRDLLLHQPSHDLDFTLPGPTRRLAKEIADQMGGAFYIMDEERDTTRVILNAGRQDRFVLDFASLRANNLKEDLHQRDFTINAMAFEISRPDRLIDPGHGLIDLQEKRIRACSNTSLEDDPVRVLRGVRMGLNLHFSIEAGTLRLMVQSAPSLRRVSPERQRDELFKLLDAPDVAQAVCLLDQIGALFEVLPELESLKRVTQSAPHVSDVWEHTLSTLSYLDQLWAALVGDFPEVAGVDPLTSQAVLSLSRFRQSFFRHFTSDGLSSRSLHTLLFLAALYHDTGKPLTRTLQPGGKIRFLQHECESELIAARRARVLALSNEETSRVKAIVRNHMRVHSIASRALESGQAPTRRAIYRFFRACSDAGVDICLLSLADTRATYETTLPEEVWLAELKACQSLLEAYWEQPEQVVSPPRWLTGEDLILTFKLKPGPLIGKLLNAIREGQAAGELTSREEALSFVRRSLDHLEMLEVQEEEE